VGIALLPHDGTASDDLLRKADIALYRAKGENRSCARFFEEGMDRQLHERSYLEHELRMAIESDALLPWYQPIVDLNSEEVVAFEALARWTHPTLGLIYPDRFIPIAEVCGQLRRLFDQLLR